MNSWRMNAHSKFTAKNVITTQYLGQSNKLSGATSCDTNKGHLPRPIAQRAPQ
jgi:hypothetical protein